MTHVTGNELAAYFAEYRAEIYRFLMRVVECEHTAQDLTQDTYLRLIDHRQEHVIENPRAYIYRIANNLALDYLRAQKRRGPVLDHTELPEIIDEHESRTANPQNILLDQQQLALLDTVIQALPKTTQDVFIRSRFLGQTHEQIAKELGISKSWVEKKIIEALSQCRQALDRPVPKK